MTYFVSVLREICLKGCAFDGKEDYSFSLSAGGKKWWPVAVILM